MTLTEWDQFMLAFHGICITLFLFFLIRALLLDKLGIRTQGKVTAVEIVEHESDSGTNISYKTHINYTDQHAISHTLKVKLASRHRVEVGAEVPIVHSSMRPSRSMLDKKIYIYLFPLSVALIYLIFGITLMLIGYYNPGGGQ